ncbi:MAG: hypothetical protein CL843_01320 [Crocinitomicaceae bacterium]|nr:hypothetical protein [Crocinitomicaceae bacterium]
MKLLSMIKNTSLVILATLSLVACQSCDQDKQRQKEIARQLEPDSLIEASKHKVEMENLQIDGYIKRRGWNMIKTGTGLRYEVYEEGAEGPLAQTGQVVTIDYQVYLINGEKVYSSEKAGPQSFEIGKADVESGLHEGMHYLKKGDKARLVIPSYLAHGLTGDNYKIPGDATIIYDLKVVDLK